MSTPASDFIDSSNQFSSNSHPSSHSTNPTLDSSTHFNLSTQPFDPIIQKSTKASKLPSYFIDYVHRYTSASYFCTITFTCMIPSSTLCLHSFYYSEISVSPEPPPSEPSSYDVAIQYHE